MIYFEKDVYEDFKTQLTGDDELIVSDYDGGYISFVLDDFGCYSIDGGELTLGHACERAYEMIAMQRQDELDNE